MFAKSRVRCHGIDRMRGYVIGRMRCYDIRRRP
jgi:hypothetical protein